MINIDTAIQRMTAAKMRNTCQQIDSVELTLKSITSHNDWTCKERNTIKAHMDSIKKDCNTIHNQADSFYVALVRTAEQMEQTETNLSSIIGQLDSTISDMINMVLSRNWGYDPRKYFFDQFKPVKWLNLTNTISIVPFASIKK